MLLSTWDQVVQELREFPAPEVALSFDDCGSSLKRTAWVFRGLKDSAYKLEPTIERAAHSKSMGWHVLERLVTDEFKSRARMHLNASSIPGDELTWLALMQHHGVPTRMLDFTYSPFVGL